MDTTKPNTQLLKSVWSRSGHALSERHIELEKFELDKLVSSIFSNGPFYFYIVDFVDMSINYASPTIADIHGLDPDTVSFQDVLDQVHPDDMEFVARAEAKAVEIVFGLIAPEKRKHYKMSYCFRFRTADGSYRLFNHQAIILTADEDGRLCKSLNIHTDISHLTETNNRLLSVIGMFGEPSFLNIEIDGEAKVPPPSKAIFSGREMEIIRLISEGLTTPDIARALNISANTVKNHRKNILQKSGCKNSGQLISKCITDGLL